MDGGGGVRRWGGLGLVGAVALAAWLLVHECAAGGAMGAMDRTCRCRGLEWTLEDRRAADGPRRSLCLGLVAERTCYRTTGGPVVPCPP